MKERPILFSGPMVLALLAGTKTQTRRLVRLKHEADVFSNGPVRGEEWETGILGDHGAIAHGEYVRCPYGEPGDRLWVRETLAVEERGWMYRADGSTLDVDPEDEERYEASRAWSQEKPGRACVSIHMPRWASRLTLEVSGIRVERLQAIKPGDILAEGVVERPHVDQNMGKCPVSRFDGKVYPDLRSLWAAGWDKINGDRAPWASNPWVWVVTFRVLP